MLKDTIVVGASAGAIAALRFLVGGLLTDLHPSLFIVVHTSAHSPAILDKILEREGGLPPVIARDGGGSAQPAPTSPHRIAIW